MSLPSDLSKLKIPELKDLCRQKGLTVVGNKAALILRLRGHSTSSVSSAPTPDALPAATLSSRTSGPVQSTGDASNKKKRVKESDPAVQSGPASKKSKKDVPSTPAGPSEISSTPVQRENSSTVVTPANNLLTSLSLPTCSPAEGLTRPPPGNGESSKGDTRAESSTASKSTSLGARLDPPCSNPSPDCSSNATKYLSKSNPPFILPSIPTSDTPQARRSPLNPSVATPAPSSFRVPDPSSSPTRAILPCEFNFSLPISRKAKAVLPYSPGAEANETRPEVASRVASPSSPSLFSRPDHRGGLLRPPGSIQPKRAFRPLTSVSHPQPYPNPDSSSQANFPPPRVEEMQNSAHLPRSTTFPTTNVFNDIDDNGETRPKPISYPPPLSLRPVSLKLSVILSQVSKPSSLLALSLSCRAVRYAVYLSSWNRLMREFSGRRLSAIGLEWGVGGDLGFNNAGVDFWDVYRQYVRERKRNDAVWRAWVDKFVALLISIKASRLDKKEERILKKGISNSLSSRLISSPDHGLQFANSLRFIIHRFLHYVFDEDSNPTNFAMLPCLDDCQVFVPGECVGKLKLPGDGSEIMTEETTWFVSDTGEVIGKESTGKNGGDRKAGDTNRDRRDEEFEVRDDWKRYIELAVLPSCSSSSSSTLRDPKSPLFKLIQDLALSSPVSISDPEESSAKQRIKLVSEQFSSLLFLISTPNDYEFPSGMSRRFVREVVSDLLPSEASDWQGMEKTRRAREKLQIATSYLLANVSPNSVSGTYRSVAAMSSEFNEVSLSTEPFSLLPNKRQPTHRALQLANGQRESVGFFLPLVHHLDSVHLSDLQDDVEVVLVQTCEGCRGHWVVKHTGQIVGNDEDGIEIGLWR